MLVSTAKLLPAAALAAFFCGALPAADPQLMSLVMPDAAVLAGVNVLQAENSPFGQWVLSQMQTKDQDMQQVMALTGFDPRRDVSELLVAMPGTTGKQNQALALASGTFNVASITAFAALHGGVTETYQGVAILEDPKQSHGIAFLSGSLVAAGDVADVKAAIDRRSVPSILPAALVTEVNQLSAAEDAWALSTIPFSTFKHGELGIPGTGDGAGTANALLNALQKVQSASSGVKFGTTVVATGQATADNAQDATTLASVLQLLTNLAAMQSSQNPQTLALLQALTVKTAGPVLTVTVSMPSAQLQQLLTPHAKVAHHAAIRN